MTITEACKQLHAAGRPDLIDGIWNHYSHLVEQVGPFAAGQVLPFMDGVLTVELITEDPVTAEDVLLSPDFAPIKALAREIQRLDKEAGLPEIDLVVED